MLAAGRVVRRSSTAEGQEQALDLEYALFVSLMPLLSPIAWDHYLSALLLPLSVLGTRTLTVDAPWPATLGFLAAVVVLLVPDTTFVYFLPALNAALPGPCFCWWCCRCAAYVLAGLSIWLAVLSWRQVFTRNLPIVNGRFLVKTCRHDRSVLAGLLLVLTLAHVAAYVRSEPYFNGDETRHLMTGVYVRDVLVDRPVTELRDYSVRYYLQYPALGLLVWPPFFYFVEGSFMLVFGTCFLAAQVLVGLFAAAACVYLFLLTHRTHGTPTAALAVLFFGLSPLVFEFSAQVMLEVPTLALALAAAWHFQRYLDGDRRRDLVLCCLATALAALTRFDGVFLAPLFVIWLAGVGRLRLLRRRSPARHDGCGAACDSVLSPDGPEHGRRSLEGGEGGHRGHVHRFPGGAELLLLSSVCPRADRLVPAAAGADRPGGCAATGAAARLLAVPGLAGRDLSDLHAAGGTGSPPRDLLGSRPCRLRRRRLLVAGSVGNEPPGRGQNLAAAGADVVARRGGRCRHGLVDSTGAGTLRPRLQGGGGLCRRPQHGDARLPVRRLSDGRLHLPGAPPRPGAAFGSTARRQVVLRYAQRPARRLRGVARNENEILALLFKYDPEYIVVEEPQIYFDLPAARLLRRTLEDHPERFVRQPDVALDSNHVTFQNGRLLIYRNVLRNPHRQDLRELRMLGLGDSLRVR